MLITRMRLDPEPHLVSERLVPRGPRHARAGQIRRILVIENAWRRVHPPAVTPVKRVHIRREHPVNVTQTPAAPLAAARPRIHHPHALRIEQGITRNGENTYRLSPLQPFRPIEP